MVERTVLDAKTRVGKNKIKIWMNPEEMVEGAVLDN